MALNTCDGGCPQLVIDVPNLPDALMANENQLYRLPNGDIYIVNPSGMTWDLINNISSTSEFKFKVASTNEIVLTWNPSTSTLTANLASEVKTRLNTIESRISKVEAILPTLTADGTTEVLKNISIIEG
nr:MAG TPA: hypothetical protein [Caudoviricetes sp.]